MTVLLAVVLLYCVYDEQLQCDFCSYGCGEAVVMVYGT